MYASDRCDGIPLEDNFSADYWFQIPSRTNSIASILLEGGERNAIYSLKISWANPRTILGMTAYPNLFYSKSFSLEKIKIIDFAGNESPITLLDY